MDKCFQAIWEKIFLVKRQEKAEGRMRDGEKSDIHCPNCDKRLWWWGYTSSSLDKQSADIGLGCENPKCKGHEVLPEDVYDAIVIEEERING